MTKTGEPMRWLIETAQRRDTDDCIDYPFFRGRTDGGYGKYRERYVNNWICELAHGKAPESKPLALHSCHKRKCCNPNHLRWGDHKDNTEDMMVANRHPHLIGYR